GLGLRHLDSPPPAPGWPAVIHPQHAKNHDAVASGRGSPLASLEKHHLSTQHHGNSHSMASCLWYKTLEKARRFARPRLILEAVGRPAYERGFLWPAKTFGRRCHPPAAWDQVEGFSAMSMGPPGRQ